MVLVNDSARPSLPIQCAGASVRGVSGWIDFDSFPIVDRHEAGVRTSKLRHPVRAERSRRSSSCGCWCGRVVKTFKVSFTCCGHGLVQSPCIRHGAIYSRAFELVEGGLTMVCSHVVR